MFENGRWRLRIIREEYIKGRSSFIFVIFVAAILIFCGFNAPRCIEVINFENRDAHDLASDLLSAFLGVLGVALAIAAIILSILQMANRKIQISELVFKFSFFAPTFYFGVLNIAILSYLEIFHSQSKIFNSEFLFVRITIISSYLFLLFCFFIIVVFYKVFRYLSFSNILTIYFRDTIDLVRFESINAIPVAYSQQLSQRGREIFQEIRDAIESEDNILLARMLDIVSSTFEINPTSNLIFGLIQELEIWISNSRQKRNRSIHYFLINFWRRLLNISANNPNSSSRAMLVGLAARVYNIS
jgi:hypothetical protein